MSEELNKTTAEEAMIAVPAPDIDEDENEEENLIVRFKKPFTFEGKVYECIDLSGLEGLNGKQLCDIHKSFAKVQAIALTPETTPAFACIAASTVSQMPIEFFYALPAKELNKIKKKVSAYFFGED